MELNFYKVESSVVISAVKVYSSGEVVAVVLASVNICDDNIL